MCWAGAESGHKKYYFMRNNTFILFFYELNISILIPRNYIFNFIVIFVP